MHYSCHNATTKLFLAIITLLSISALCSGFVPPSFRQSAVKLSMASSFLMESPRQSFEDRMRNAVLGGRSREPSPASKMANLPENIKVATTLDEYKKIVGGERERLVVVRFYAPWCKVRHFVGGHIRAMGPALERCIKGKPIPTMLSGRGTLHTGDGHVYVVTDAHHGRSDHDAFSTYNGLNRNHRVSFFQTCMVPFPFVLVCDARGWFI